MPHNIPQCISVDAVNSLLIVDKVDRTEEFYSSACSKMIRVVKIWSIRDLSLWNPTYVCRILASTAVVFILSNNFLLNIFPGIDNIVIPL